MTVQNLEFAAPSDDVIIQNTGVYQIFYAVLYSSASGSRLQLKQNGEGLTNTSVNIVAAPQGEVSAVVLLELSAGDALSLGITSGNVTLTTQGQSAILTMLQVG